MSANSHLELLYDISKLSSLLAGSSDIVSFLKRTVELLASHLKADVCSIYLYDDDSRELRLAATHGLSSDSVGEVSLKIGEGLVGLALKELRPICESCASKNPNFKLIDGLNEEPFESFLAIPIVRGIERVGVLVLQRRVRNFFSSEDVTAFQVIASQLAGAIENARILMVVHGGRHIPEKALVVDETEDMRLFKGAVASEGFAHARVLVVDVGHEGTRLENYHFDQDYTSGQFDHAVEETARQLKELEARLEERLPEMASMIFDAHQMILKDPQFVGAMQERICNGENPPVAVQAIAQQYIDFFSASTHAYIREKVDDIKDLARRLIANLRGDAPDVGQPCEGCIVFAREVFPSDILKYTSEGVAGMVLASGGVTSHASILARSLQVPLVIVSEPEIMTVKKGTEAILDAEVGNVYIRPTAEVIEQFDLRERARAEAQPAAEQMQPRTLTRDGTQVLLQANINLLSDLKLAGELKAEGVGLYRSEFPFLIRSTFPSEEEQYVVYRALYEEMGERPVTIRTLDVGGDKVLSYYDGDEEENPALGLRSIRFSLGHADIFRQQIRAILRASRGTGPARIMFPMIASLDDFRRCREHVSSCLEELHQEGDSDIAQPSVGMMIELPSVLEIMTEFAAEVEFFSIGTNDFVQYMLGVDRGNEKVASYYIPHHPSVLRALSRIVWLAGEAGRPVSVCGEMAHVERYIPFLIGIGVRSLSVDPRYLPRVQQAIVARELGEMEELARRMLGCATVAEVEKVMATKK